MWKFRLKSDTTFNLSAIIGQVKDYHFNKAAIVHNDYLLLTEGIIKDGVLTIYKGYEWDGCTPKFRFFGKILGVPDFDGTYYPSLVHDFLIEYCLDHDIKREQIDNLFEALLKKEKFKFAWLYAGVVHLYRKITFK